MDGPRGCYAQWNNSRWKRKTLDDFTYLWNLKENLKQNKTKQMNEQTNKKQTQTYKYREHTGGCQRRGGWGIGKTGEGEWEIQASGYGMNKSWEWKVQHREYTQWYYALHGDRWGLHLWWTRHNYRVVKSLHWIPETSVNVVCQSHFN